MCLMLPARVISRDGDVCMVESLGRRQVVSTLMTPEIERGDWVLVASDAIVRRVMPDQAAAMARAVNLATGATSVDEGAES